MYKLLLVMLTRLTEPDRRTRARGVVEGARGFVLALAAASVVDASAAWALEALTLTFPSRILVALAPLPGNLALIALVLRRVRALDEFQRRVHLDAVVIAFLATGVAAFIYGYLRKAAAVPPLNAVHVWIFMSVTYGIGYAIAARHYR